MAVIASILLFNALGSNGTGTRTEKGAGSSRKRNWPVYGTGTRTGKPRVPRKGRRLEVPGTGTGLVIQTGTGSGRPWVSRKGMVCK